MNSKDPTCCNLICFTEKLQFEKRIKEMEKAIKKHKKQNPWKALPRKCDTELYKVVEKERK